MKSCERGHKSRRARRSVEVLLFELLDEWVLELEDTPDEFRRQAKPENAVEFWIALGMDEKYATNRYKAISKIMEALNLKRKTSTLDSVRHLLRKIPLNNRFNEFTGMDEETRRINYRWFDGLSYRGYKVSRAKGITDLLDRVNSHMIAEGDFYVHRTNGTILGRLFRHRHIKSSSMEEGYDFGPGIYCFKNEWKNALSFAINICWPLRINNKEHIPIFSHNPCLVLFEIYNVE